MLDPERPLEPPEEKFVHTCPVCGAECETLYISYLHAVLGCDECVAVKDAREYWDEERERREDTVLDENGNSGDDLPF